MADRIDIFWSHGLPFCPACQSPLGFEEASFECCDACGGEGLESNEDEIPDDELLDLDVEAHAHADR